MRRVTPAAALTRAQAAARSGASVLRTSVASTVARARSPTSETRQRAPFHQQPSPGAATIVSPSAGKAAAPAVTSSPSTIATNVAQSGTPRMKLLVPSIGSMIQRRCASGRTVPSSSPRMPSAGKSDSMRSRAARSAARSQAVTGEPSGLVSTVPATVRADSCRNPGSAAAPATRATSSAASMSELTAPPSAPAERPRPSRRAPA